MKPIDEAYNRMCMERDGWEHITSSMLEIYAQAGNKGLFLIYDTILNHNKAYRRKKGPEYADIATAWFRDKTMDEISQMFRHTTLQNPLKFISSLSLSERQLERMIAKEDKEALIVRPVGE